MATKTKTMCRGCVNDYYPVSEWSDIVSDTVREAAKRRFEISWNDELMQWESADENEGDVDCVLVEDLDAILSAAYLAEHPDDDDTPVGWVWLGRSLPIAVATVDAVECHVGSVAIVAYRTGESEIHCGDLTRTGVTRGDVRRLVAVLGGELLGKTK